MEDMDIQPAINRMNIPWRGINQCKIGDLDVFRVHNFYKVRPRVLKLSLVEFIPPDLALTINGSIVSWKMIRQKSSYNQLEYASKTNLEHIFVTGTRYNNISEIGSKDKTDISSSCCIPSATIWWQRINNRPLALILNQYRDAEIII